ncbi:MAG: hypothetical protein R3E95_20750 [Thiolinea sp.]
MTLNTEDNMMPAAADNQVDRYRRKFMAAVTGAAAVATVAPGVFLRTVQAAEGDVFAKPAEQPVSSKVRWGMLIDTQRLTDGGAPWWRPASVSMAGAMIPRRVRISNRNGFVPSR